MQVANKGRTGHQRDRPGDSWPVDPAICPRGTRPQCVVRADKMMSLLEHLLCVGRRSLVSHRNPAIAEPPWETYGPVPHLPWSLYTCNNIVIARQLTLRACALPLQQRQWRRQTTVVRRSHLCILTTQENRPTGWLKKKKDRPLNNYIPGQPIEDSLYNCVINTSFFASSCEKMAAS